MVSLRTINDVKPSDDAVKADFERIEEGEYVVLNIFICFCLRFGFFVLIILHATLTLLEKHLVWKNTLVLQRKMKRV